MDSIYSATIPLNPVANSAAFNTKDFLLFEIFNVIYYFPKPPDLDLVDEAPLYLEELALFRVEYDL